MTVFLGTRNAENWEEIHVNGPPSTIETDDMEAKVLLRVFNFPETAHDAAYFEGKRRRLSIQIHIRFKKEWTGDDLSIHVESSRCKRLNFVVWSAFFEKPLSIPMFAGRIFSTFWYDFFLLFVFLNNRRCFVGTWSIHYRN